nr:MAG TPA: hypothetical protein [Caudoviricetes sp.]
MKMLMKNYSQNIVIILKNSLMNSSMSLKKME